MKNETNAYLLTRREVLAGSVCLAGALAAGCKPKGRIKKPETGMVYRPLGKTGLEVSEIGFGAEWMVRHTAEECAALARACEQRGINIIDCWMGDPEVRDKVGYALRGHRDEWIIQGHVGATWQNGKFKIDRDVAACRVAFEDLLKRLDVDYVDLGMIFLVDSKDEFAKIAAGPVADYMRELKACGKIRHIGMSTHNPEVALAAAKSGLVEMMLFSVNPAYDILPPMEDHHRLFNDETFDSDLGGIAPIRAQVYRECAARNIGLTVMKTYAGGRLLDAARSPFKVALTPVQCIHYALTRPAVASVLIGYDTPAHVEAAAAYCRSTAKERDYATVLAKAPRHAYDGQCTYCAHCAPCKVGIDIATVNKLYDLAVSQPTVPDSVRKHYHALKHHAKECTACGRCEKRCPFHVKVHERMKLAAALFGE